MKPWKRVSLEFWNAKGYGLQWGHGDEAVEETTRPRHSWRRFRLQWGHGDEAVEEGAARKFLEAGAGASMGPRR